MTDPSDEIDEGPEEQTSTDPSVAPRVDAVGTSKRIQDSLQFTPKQCHRCKKKEKRCQALTKRCRRLRGNVRELKQRVEELRSVSIIYKKAYKLIVIVNVLNCFDLSY